MTSFLGSLLRRDRWPLWIGGAIGVLVLAWLLRGLDFGRFVEVARGADVGPLLLLPLAIVAEHFGRGLVLPQSGTGRAVILGAAVTMKALAASHLLWAGLAFGVVLAPMDYLFLMVFLGFIATLAGTLRIVGAFTAAGVFARGLFDVAVEQALAIALVVEAANHLTVAVVGGICFAVEGISRSDVRRLRGRLANQGDRRDECR